MRRIACAAVVFAFAASLGAQGKYKAPRTAWGDPDLSGNYTNKYEQGTPFERPRELDGKTLDQITPAELRDILAARQKNSIERAPFNGGDPEGRIGGPAEFRDNNEILKGSVAWFVVDPPDGHIPAQVPEAAARIRALPRWSWARRTCRKTCKSATCRTGCR